MWRALGRSLMATTHCAPYSSTELFWHTAGKWGARVSVQPSLAPALLMLLMVSLFFKALRDQINQNNGDDARD